MFLQSIFFFLALCLFQAAGLLLNVSDFFSYLRLTLKLFTSRTLSIFFFFFAIYVFVFLVLFFFLVLAGPCLFSVYLKPRILLFFLSLLHLFCLFTVNDHLPFLSSPFLSWSLYVNSVYIWKSIFCFFLFLLHPAYLFFAVILFSSLLPHVLSHTSLIILVCCLTWSP